MDKLGIGHELIEGIENLQRHIEELEDENTVLRDELIELRGFVPGFPSEEYATHPNVYIQEFNKMRHLKP
jgi:hypothetical protein